MIALATIAGTSTLAKLSTHTIIVVTAPVRRPTVTFRIGAADDCWAMILPPFTINLSQRPICQNPNAHTWGARAPAIPRRSETSDVNRTAFTTPHRPQVTAFSDARLASAPTPTPRSRRLDLRSAYPSTYSFRETGFSKLCCMLSGQGSQDFLAASRTLRHVTKGRDRLH